MKCFLAVALVLIPGCSSSQKAVKESPAVHLNAVAAVPVKEPDLTDKQKIALLRAEAHKRGLRWTVTCMDHENSQEQFFAEANDKRDPDAGVYIEDGALPWWAEYGATQTEAAYRLYQSIQQPPNMHPSHRPEEKHTHKICPAQLRGE